MPYFLAEYVIDGRTENISIPAATSEDALDHLWHFIDAPPDRLYKELKSYGNRLPRKDVEERAKSGL